MSPYLGKTGGPPTSFLIQKHEAASGGEDNNSSFIQHSNRQYDNCLPSLEETEVGPTVLSRCPSKFK